MRYNYIKRICIYEGSKLYRIVARLITQIKRWILTFRMKFN